MIDDCLNDSHSVESSDNPEVSQIETYNYVETLTKKERAAWYLLPQAFKLE
jgi:hypothetical protein